jgi:hypothetical protein
VGYCKSDTTGKASTWTSMVKSHLINEGYAPSIDSDGDIKFKAEGRTYYIAIVNYEEGVYMDMFMLINIEDESQSKVRIAAMETQKSLKFVRFEVSSESLSIDVMHYFDTLSTFKTMFPNMLSIIQTARTRFIDKYN